MIGPVEPARLNPRCGPCSASRVPVDSRSKRGCSASTTTARSGASTSGSPLAARSSPRASTAGPSARPSPGPVPAFPPRHRLVRRLGPRAVRLPPRHGDVRIVPGRRQRLRRTVRRRHRLPARTRLEPARRSRLRRQRPRDRGHVLSLLGEPLPARAGAQCVNILTACRTGHRPSAADRRPTVRHEGAEGRPRWPPSCSHAA